MAEGTNSSSAALKEQGNAAYKAGNFEQAIDFFGQAIEIDPNNEKLFCNRSMCHGSLKNWAAAALDAKRAVELSDTYAKAYFWLVKASMELGDMRSAKLFLLHAFNKCGEGSKDFATLEAAITEQTGVPLRPKSSDFDFLEELGKGNFTSIYKAQFVHTGQLYAIKVIEKDNVEKTRKRHPNIHNEILMEKRVLNKLSHPNVATLYSTFQDAKALFYQMELCEGGELWSLLNFRGFAVGLHWSQAKYFMAEIINAVEYMHQKGIVHRDLKPENVMVTAAGHVKVVDFGTAKDLVEFDLNGQNFVGTAEYMAPRTVKSKPVGFEVDLWALGVVLHQLYLGFTPFAAPSPYLSFIRIKRATVRHATFTPPEFQDLLSLLLEKDDNERFRRATGGMSLPPLPPTPPAREAVDPDDPYAAARAAQDPEVLAERRAKMEEFAAAVKADEPEKRHAAYKAISYDTLRKHPFFTNHTAVNSCQECEHYATPESFRSMAAHPNPTRVPRLQELCLRVAAMAVLITADATSRNGGVRPVTEPGCEWMRTVDCMKLTVNDRERMMHLLDRMDSLHPPSTYRLFNASVPDARCKRVNTSSLEYYGYTRSLQGHWKGDFFFIQIADPQFGMKADGPPDVSDGRGGDDWSFEEGHTKKAISAINKLRPRFVLCSGDQTNAHPAQECYKAQVVAFRKSISRISETIPVVYVCGNHDIGDNPTMESLLEYRKHFGPDYFGFWHGGVRCLVINSCLMMKPTAIPEVSRAQDVWLEEEIEQAKLCAQQVLIFSHHPWFLTSVDEDEGDSGYWIIPKPTRDRWFKMLRHKKVGALFAGHYHRNVVSMPFPRKKKGAAAAAVAASSAAAAVELGDITLTGGDEADKKKAAKKEAREARRAARQKRAPESYSDSESDSGSDEDDNVDEDDVVNPLEKSDGDYEGPEMITTNSVGMSLDQQCAPGIRIVKVYEDRVTHQYHEVDSIPAAVTL